MTTEYYHYGQGKLWSRRLDVPGAQWRWWGDCSAAEIALEVENLEHRESYSGVRGLARRFPTVKSLTLNATVHQLDTQSLQELLWGEATDVAGGTVVGESLGTVAVGDVIKLDFPGVSSLVISDSATPTPATIAALNNYELDGRFGSVEFIGLPNSPAPTMPLTAAYTYAAHKAVNIFTQPQPIIEFRYEGVNLAEGNAPQIVELYRLATDPLQQLALINNDTSLAGAPVSAGVLIDPTKPATGQFGQFGRILHLAQNWAP